MRSIVTGFITLSLTLIIAISSFAIDCIPSRSLFDIEPNANQPSDIAIAANGDVYLVDGVNSRIIVTDSSGRWKFAFGSTGKGAGEFNFPLGIDISDAGKVFVADTGNHRIQVFDTRGTFLYMFPVDSGSREKESDPVDVAVSGLRNYLYVSDNDLHTIRVYDQQGKFQFSWGGFGEDPGKFRYPATMAINQYNEIFIVDVLNTRVQKFDPFGKLISDIGGWGVLQGNFFRPKGVAVDKLHRVFVSDSYMSVIQVFTDLGRVLGVLCDGGKLRKFRAPVGLAVDSKERLFVVEMRGNKITVLKLQD